MNAFRAGLLPPLLLLLTATVAAERPLAVADEELIPVELATVGVVPMTGTPVVLLREPEQGRTVPIFIGPAEARAILLAQRGIEPERPLTHDLLVAVMNGLGGRLERVVVDELRDSTYLGALEIRLSEPDRLIRIDSRPSDALAMAVRTGARIAVAPAVLAANEDLPFEGLGDDDRVTALGITVMEVSRDLRQALNLPEDAGVLVSSVSGIAAVLGLQPGALVVAVNDTTPPSPLGFLELVNATPRGEKARIRYWAGGEYRTIELETTVPAPGSDERRRRI